MSIISDADRRWMQECFALAAKGSGHVSPNPLVGCVIVRDEKILATGYHHRFGALHAEADALCNAKENVTGATLYVNLEPCNHTGKTPPCTEAIIVAGIKRVVIGARDPNANVRGGGIRRLRSAGIEVVDGVLRNGALALNKFFYKWIRTGTPYVTVKLAQSLDGKISAKRGAQTAISGKESLQYVHRLRAAYDAVLIGAGTMKTDHPKLTVRLVKGRNPIRIILDPKLSAKYSEEFIRGKALTIVYVAPSTLNSRAAAALMKTNLLVVPCAMKGNDCDLSFVLNNLGQSGVASVLVEGGSALATAFLKQHLADELQLIVAPKIFGGGVDAFAPQAAMEEPVSFSAEPLGKDLLITARF